MNEVRSSCEVGAVSTSGENLFETLCLTNRLLELIFMSQTRLERAWSWNLRPWNL